MLQRGTLVRVGLLFSIVFSMTAAAETVPAIVEIRVDAAIVRPVRSDGLQWDGIDADDVPAVVSKQVQTQVQHWVEHELVSLGAGATLAVPAARLALQVGKWFNKTIAPPDPIGEVMVDGHVVAVLPRLPNTFSPAWPTIAGQYVPITGGSTITVKLWDVDGSGMHDSIGSCDVVIASAPATAQRLISRSCTGDLLAVSVVLSLGAEPRPMVAGAYRIAMAKVGIQPQTPAGVPWDVTGEPDPRIQIVIGGQTIDCPVTQGQHASICQPSPSPVAITATTTISFRVTEVDALVDDLVGGATVTDLLTANSGRPITMTVSDSVAWAELVLEPLSGVEPSAPAADR